MKQLTQEQADKLRAIRKLANNSARGVADVVHELCSVCHMDKISPSCPVCDVYKAFEYALRELGDVCDRLDFYLERGPMPAPQGEERT